MLYWYLRSKSILALTSIKQYFFSFDGCNTKQNNFNACTKIIILHNFYTAQVSLYIKLPVGLNAANTCHSLESTVTCSPDYPLSSLRTSYNVQNHHVHLSFSCLKTVVKYDIHDTHYELHTNFNTTIIFVYKRAASTSDVIFSHNFRIKWNPHFICTHTILCNITLNP